MNLDETGPFMDQWLITKRILILIRSFLEKTRNLVQNNQYQFNSLCQINTKIPRI